MMGNKTDISTQLRFALKGTDKSLYAIAKDAGIDTAVLYRYVTGERDIYLDTAAKIADSLGLELVPRRR